ncbi:MAG: sodium-translocating pyrophosphatase [Anaerolineae bacterium]
MSLLLISAGVGLVAIAVAVLTFRNLRKAPIQFPNMAEIASYIATGVRAYLSRQLKTILLVTPFLAAVVWALLGPWVALTFTLGIFTSLITTFLGMSAAVRANEKTAEDATTSPIKAFRTAVLGGSVMGFSIAGFSLVVLSILYFVFRGPNPLIGFGFGASLAALFAQIGGGIYTKSADIGADLVGKIEKGIPEDDPRNAAVIADLVGDNVGDCAGRGSDLFQTFSDDIVTGTLVVTVLIAAGRYVPQAVFFPLLLQSVGLLASLVGVFSMRTLKTLRPEASFNVGMIVNTVLATLGSWLLTKYLLHDVRVFWGCFLGILVTLVAVFFTRYYAGANGKPVRKMAEAAKRGAALNLITGIAFGLQSPLASIVMIAIAVSVAYIASGGSLLGVVAVNIGTDLLIGYIMTADAFGPITDNAAGIAEMSGASEQVVRSLSSLDAIGNTMKATTKAYAMSSGTITAFVLFVTFFDLVGLREMDISQPFSVAFLFLGIAFPYLIASLVIGSTAKTALQMVDEVRRQFRTIPGLMEGQAKPDYAACVDIATKNALREMVLPGLLSIAIPIAVGFAFGAWALGALLIGAVAAAALLGPFFNNLGTALDNAKKIIEGGGHKGTFEHQSAVIGDTVGDPLKDVAGPSLLIFMKLIGMTALLMANVIR